SMVELKPRRVEMTQRILIIGAGFAGMWSALSAARLLDQAKTDKTVEIALIAPEPALHERPRLYEVRPDEREVEAAGPDGKSFTVSYDRLVLATGSKLIEPPIPGLKEHSFNV